MNHEEFHELSLKLIEIGSQAAIRSAISRSYYSVFHAAREATSSIQLDRPPKGSHAIVNAKVKEMYGKALADQMHRMKVRRNRADYDIDHEIYHEEAIRMAANREFFLAEMSSSEHN